MFKTILLVLASVYTTLANFSFNVPNGNSRWLSGDSITLRWSTSDYNQNLDFSLMRGDPNNLQFVAYLGNAPVEAKFVSVRLPTNLGPGGDYTIKGQGSKDVNYSHTFFINQM